MKSKGSCQQEPTVERSRGSSYLRLVWLDQSPFLDASAGVHAEEPEKSEKEFTRLHRRGRLEHPLHNSEFISWGDSCPVAQLPLTSPFHPDDKKQILTAEETRRYTLLAECGD